MILNPTDPVAGGVLQDTHRRDVMNGGAGDDIFTLFNDGKTDEIMDMSDGSDLVDISAWDAAWDELMVKQISLTEYMVTYLQEEALRITFAQPAPADIPSDGVLLSADDFIFREGLPDATTQVIFEASTTEKEVIFGTSLPDVFLFEDDGLRETIRKFEPGKDMIDLADYSVTFDALRVREVKEGRIVLRIPGDGKMDKLILIDVSRQLTAEDIVEDMFMF